MATPKPGHFLKDAKVPRFASFYCSYRYDDLVSQQRTDNDEMMKACVKQEVVNQVMLPCIATRTVNVIGITFHWAHFRSIIGKQTNKQTINKLRNGIYYPMIHKKLISRLELLLLL